jgi:hypothetical protein
MMRKLGLVTSVLVASVFTTTAVLAAGPRDGLYLMTRYLSGLELDGYYFKAGQVLRSPIGNIATLDIAAAGRARPAFYGQIDMTGNKMRVRWGDNRTSESVLEVTAGDPCFAWDGGIFCPVTGFKAGERLNGSFEGGLRSSSSVGTASNLRTVTFTSAGTYQMDATGEVHSTADPSSREQEDDIAGFSAGQESGTYTLSGTDLALQPGGRAPYHVLTFPYNVDDNAKSKPDHVYFGGTMLQRLR